MKLIKNGLIMAKGGLLEDYAVLFEDRILGIVPIGEVKNKTFEDEIDAGGNIVLPGFIDIHIHGIGGADVMDAKEDTLKIMSKELVKHGVTSYLPTTMTMSIDKIENAFCNIRSFIKKNNPYARVLGVHMEGPYISSVFKGAQDEKYILEPDINFVRDYYDILKVITIAPEINGAEEFIKDIRGESNVVLSIGHSNADYDICKKAHDLGAGHITHLFNAMKPLHHREPGTVGAALNLDFTCEVILDTIHINKELFDFIYRVKGSDMLIGISDCMRAGGLKAGDYDLGGQRVVVDSNSARLLNGQLAGSILTLDKALKNLIKFSNIDLLSAVKLFTLNPARLLKRNDIGIIDVGCLSDFVIINKEFEVVKTIVNGKTVYDKF